MHTMATPATYVRSCAALALLTAACAGRASPPPRHAERAPSAHDGAPVITYYALVPVGAAPAQPARVIIAAPPPATAPSVTSQPGFTPRDSPLLLR